MSALQKRVEAVEKALKIAADQNKLLGETLIAVAITSRDCASIINLLLQKSGYTNAEITAAIQEGISKNLPNLGLRPQDSGAVVRDSGVSDTGVSGLSLDRGASSLTIAKGNGSEEVDSNGDHPVGDQPPQV